MLGGCASKGVGKKKKKKKLNTWQEQEMGKSFYWQLSVMPFQSIMATVQPNQSIV